MRLGAILLLSASLLAASAPALAQSAPPTSGAGKAPSVAETKALITTLKDPAERSQLIAQLELMVHAKQEEAPAEPTALDATADLAQRLSRKLSAASEELMATLATMGKAGELRHWVMNQFRLESRRAIWTQVMVNLVLTIGLGYLALFLLRLALRRVRQRITAHSPKRFWVRLPLLSLAAVIDLVPIVAFGVVAYVTLGYLAPRPETRLVAIVWVQAVILAQLAAAASRALLAAGSPAVRFVPLSDHATQQGERWARLIAGVVIYGYFGLQAGKLLGMPRDSLDVLMRLLGLAILILMLMLVIRLRAPVERWIRGRERASGPLRDLRVRLASVWHIPALLYLVVLYGVWALDVNNGSILMLKGTLLTVLILVLAAWLSHTLDRAIVRRLSPTPRLGDPRRPFRVQLRRYERILRAGNRWGIAALALVLILWSWQLPSLRWVTREPLSTILITAGTLILTIVVAIAIWEITTHAISRYLEGTEDTSTGTRRSRSARAHTLLAVARTALLILLSVVTILMALTQLGVNTAPLLAAAGVIGVAVGFGAQKLVQDIITGFFFLLENTFAVGDVIQVGSLSGLVEAVSIRNVRLRDLAGTVHTIPFSTIDRVSNLTKDFSCTVFDIGISYRESVDDVIRVLQGIGAELQRHGYFGKLILGEMEIFGLDALGDSAVVIKGRIKTLPGKQWEISRELNRRVKAKFDELGIEIPFPHRTLYFGVGKDGTAPPAWVRGAGGGSEAQLQPSAAAEG